ncbi:helix-turn-helix domain-containing protein [Mucilaginibacter glaciei]|uniref:Helix-turn-helix transcriptional regulator n=1 Tax=Mucilaginibacter glaciei TaxID=2772109 RepID=A0A926NPP9_9SPHI|nr:helix-turn-helix transcriptional regulator [Mucilaginibacter glaciei]MBD1392375.1 helix-turn-helix transcriptional regulator [Mucilaginibacter glaciei]
MSFFHVNISEIDTQIAQFARAIALPIRVFILRMIAENGNALTKQAFYNNTFNATTINKHLLELRSLGIVKVKTVQAQATYYIDQKMFDQMSANFSMFFDNSAAANNSGLLTAASEIPAAKNFGAFIKQHRMELNLSQEALASKLAIDRALLSRIENGKKQLDAAKLVLLSQALYIKIDDLELAYAS